MRTTRPIKLNICGRGSVLIWQPYAIRYVLPVVYDAIFPIMLLYGDVMLPQQQRCSIVNVITALLYCVLT